MNNINKMNLYMVGINKYITYLKKHLIYIIYFYFIFYLGYFNILKNVLLIKSLAIT